MIARIQSWECLGHNRQFEEEYDLEDPKDKRRFYIDLHNELQRGNEIIVNGWEKED